MDRQKLMMAAATVLAVGLAFFLGFYLSAPRPVPQTQVQLPPVDEPTLEIPEPTPAVTPPEADLDVAGSMKSKEDIAADFLSKPGDPDRTDPMLPPPEAPGQ